MAPTNQQIKNTKIKQLSSKSGKSSSAKVTKARVQRYLKSTEATLKETSKSTLLLKGIKCNQSMFILLKDLRSMLSPHVKLLNKKNNISPMEEDGQNSMEFLTIKNDCSIFGLASSNKKRPNNLVLGRTFNKQILDLMELGILRYKSISDYNTNNNNSASSDPHFTKRIGSKPLMLFVGDLWIHNPSCMKLQNLLIDLYKGTVVDKLVLNGLDHIIVFTAIPIPDDVDDNNHNPNINKNNDQHPFLFHQRTYFMQLKKNPNGSNIPAPVLTNCGPDMDFELRRTQYASSELWKASIKQPAKAIASKSSKTSKKKNQSTNVFGETIGRLHVEKQTIGSNIHGKKSKAIRIASKIHDEEEKSLLDNELNQEKHDIDMEFKQTYGFNEE